MQSIRKAIALALISISCASAGLAGASPQYNPVSGATTAPSGDIGASIRPESQAKRPAKYPKTECREAIGGSVSLVTTVNSAGSAFDIQVESSSGNRNLDRAAIEAAKRWRYLPATVNGKKTGGRIRSVVEFDPDGEQCRKILGS